MVRLGAATRDHMSDPLETVGGHFEFELSGFVSTQPKARFRIHLEQNVRRTPPHGAGQVGCFDQRGGFPDEG